ncbi:alpha/beta hydrolase [Nonomuraea jiangxiensis]|uniref:Lysophospholipase, alpha-beta hydrolase superfamily n=1 Tax=Nonomuraea jiangxiensis TaxID=633440 RepID=A0A1G8UT81_9ACTN|nr:alpha/beta hydrolase [Nonomuraea jiangxiensis]SDJ57086.1 Lysophospholipase, alpha-beta hydrolase superfamily [Nonomuraea jiangxiensis]
MAESREHTFIGTRGRNRVRAWPHDRPRYVAVLVHGYGEHIGRYEYVADRLVRHGAAVYGPDHMGHGRSDGDRVHIEDFEDVVTDVHSVVGQARADHPGVPVVVIGHSMGGLIATRYAQRYGDDLTALVLSGPVIGEWEVLTTLLAYEEPPHTPIDPATLSRDPSVGTAYEEDPLVWHGPFKRPTLEALATTLAEIAKSGRLGALPTLWVHGADDALVPLAGSRSGIEATKGPNLTERIYPGARHEVFNETNRDEVLDDVTTFVDRALPT